MLPHEIFSTHVSSFTHNSKILKALKTKNCSYKFDAKTYLLANCI